MAKSNSAFMKPMTISADLAAVVGAGPMPRSEVTKKIWVYRLHLTLNLRLLSVRVRCLVRRS